MLVSEVHEAYFDDEVSPVAAVAFDLHDNQLSLRVTVDLDDYQDADEVRVWSAR
jgi:hypothetical protein